MIWVQWVEPFNKSSDPVFMRISKETAINTMKEIHPDVYENDEEAFLYFVAVHWASVVGDEGMGI